MKCRNCGINFYDEEKACPMCGARASRDGQKKGVRPTILNGRAVGGGALPRTTGHTVLNGKKTRAARQFSGDGKPAEHKKSGAVGWLVALGIIFKIGSELLSSGGLGDVGTFAREKIADFTGGSVPAFSDSVPEPMPDRTVEASLAGGWKFTEAHGAQATLYMQPEGTYTMHLEGKTWIADENGVCWTEPEPQGTVRAEGMPPAEEFDAYTLHLEMHTRTASGDEAPEHETSYILTLYQSKKDDTVIAVDDTGALVQEAEIWEPMQ